MSERRFPAPIDPDVFPEGAWLCPLELVLAAPASSVMPGLVRKRMSLHDWAHPDVVVFKHGKRFFADVRFNGQTRPSLMYPLDVWAAENGL
jgi:hypothetical protein